MPTVTTGLNIHGMNIFVFFLGHGYHHRFSELVDQPTPMTPTGDCRRDQSAAASLLDAINPI
jgi:hypothetical protein